jgi:hypothetical protein
MRRRAGEIETALPPVNAAQSPATALPFPPHL